MLDNMSISFLFSHWENCPLSTEDYFADVLVRCICILHNVQY